jgi:thiol-disulfide isomerase/thioredoxin
MKENGIVVGIVVLLLVVSGVLFVVSGGSAGSTPAGVADAKDGKTLELAQCLKDSGTVFYGAFWCPHCKTQKALFGDAVKVLPYVECSTPDGNAQTQACISKGIKSYPTWIFPDGSQLTGEVPLATLAEKSKCTPSTPPSADTVPDVSVDATTAPVSMPI